MTDQDDYMNDDYDWYQNTGELREFFEDDYRPSGGNQPTGGEGCIVLLAIVSTPLLFLLL